MGRYRIELHVSYQEYTLKAKLLYFRVGEKDSQIHLQSVWVRLMARVPTVGEHLVATKQVTLQKLEYDIMGS